jgi:hypothetical protein
MPGRAKAAAGIVAPQHGTFRSVATVPADEGGRPADRYGRKADIGMRKPIGIFGAFKTGTG